MKVNDVIHGLEGLALPPCPNERMLTWVMEQWRINGKCHSYICTIYVSIWQIDFFLNVVLTIDLYIAEFLSIHGTIAMWQLQLSEVIQS